MPRPLHLVLAAVCALAAVPGSAVAAAPRDGLGLFVADDDWDHANPGALPSLGGDFGPAPARVPAPDDLEQR